MPYQPSMFRVGSEREARDRAVEIRERAERKENAYVARAGNVQRAAEPQRAGLAAEDMDGLELDPDEFAAATKKIGALLDRFDELLERSRDLDTGIGAGGDVVAQMMAKRFRHRGSVGPGTVRQALNEYRSELRSVLAALTAAQWTADNTENAVESGLGKHADKLEEGGCGDSATRG